MEGKKIVRNKHSNEKKQDPLGQTKQKLIYFLSDDNNETKRNEMKRGLPPDRLCDVRHL